MVNEAAEDRPAEGLVNTLHCVLTHFIREIWHYVTLFKVIMIGESFESIQDIETTTTLQLKTLNETALLELFEQVAGMM